MSNDTKFLISLLETGDEGSNYRCENYNDELQRKHIAQRMDSDLMVQSDLFSVVHGTLTPDGEAATLIVMDFRFFGSQPGGRRFRKAVIEVGFSQHGTPMGRMDDPVVLQIAPYEAFAMDPAITQHETTLSATTNADAGPAGLATIGIGAGYEKKTTLDKKAYTTLYGTKWIAKRSSGEANTAKWMIWENEIAKNGIPTGLRTAILVKPKSDKKFSAHVKITADVDLRHKIRQVLGETKVDPVFFGELSNRRNMGVALDVDTTNLEACDLSFLGTIKVRSGQLPHTVVFPS